MNCREFEEAGISLNAVDFKQLIISALKRLHGEVCKFCSNYFEVILNTFQLLIYLQYIQKGGLEWKAVKSGLIEISVLGKLLLTAVVVVYNTELGFRLLISCFFAYQPLSGASSYPLKQSGHLVSLYSGTISCFIITSLLKLRYLNDSNVLLYGKK